MATITRIEVANFLCDGYVEGREWVPLYRGETFRLFGCSAALQIDNGGGKTSLTEASLFLLSQDRRLKPKIAERIAPPEYGWTHIRIEFIEKPIDEDVLQRDLITFEPEDIPGVTYVIGLAWSRGKDPNFYLYQGFLADAPCYNKTSDKLQLVDNETFRRSVERMPGARWNKWRNQKDWLEEIRQFTNVEVIKKNVKFQLEGAGDYSAMINKVEPENGESYDAAFFRQFVAPELLRQSMGAEGEDDEEQFEDTLYKTLKPTADALVNINLRQHELNDAEAALTKFKPVEDKAQAVVAANRDYEEELSNVVQDASVVHALSVREPIPGMPTFPRDASWSKDRKLMAVVSNLVIDKKAGVLIPDQALAKLLGTETKRINERALSLLRTPVICGTQLIDLLDGLKESHLEIPEGLKAGGDGYVIENKDGLKESKRGQHRKYAITGYTLDDAKALLPAGDPQNLTDLLTRAFGIVADIVDTNPYRKAQQDLTGALNKATAEHAAAEEEANHWGSKLEVLQAESREAAENQVAYETYAARVDQFLPEHKNAPREAREWGQSKLLADQRAVSDHTQKVTSHAGRFDTWTAITNKYAGQALMPVLKDLNKKHSDTIAAGDAAREAMSQACEQRDGLRPRLKIAEAELKAATEKHRRLDELAEHLPTFHQLFGDVDPLLQDPQANLADANRDHASARERLMNANDKRAKLDGLKPKVNQYLEVFGDADPETLSPLKDLLALKSKIAIEETILADHQPYIEAISQFQEAYGKEAPEQRLAAIDRQRGEWLADRSRIKDDLLKIDGELRDLSTYSVADDRVYASALSVLNKAGIQYKRLHTVVMAVAGARQEAMLSLHSSALSAPVVLSVEEADKATAILEKAGLTVPVFLEEPLLEFIRTGSYKVTGNVTHAIFAGRATRQVKILLYPALIEEERTRLTGERVALQERDVKIERDLEGIAPSSDLVAMILKANEGIKRGSEKAYAEADERLNLLSPQLPKMQRRAESADSIGAMKEFQSLGGENAWRDLVALTIPNEEDQVSKATRRIAECERLVGEDALRALIAAKDFSREGGKEAFEKAASDVSRLEPLKEDLSQQLNTLLAQIEGALANNQRAASEALEALNQSYSIDKRDLEVAIGLEADGLVEFMQNAEATGVTLQETVNASIARLRDIDFERAQRYIDSSEEDGLDLSDRIANAKHNQSAAIAMRNEAAATKTHLNGQISAMQSFVDDLHDAVVELREQYAKVASFSDDIRGRISIGKVYPEILGYAETLQMGSLGKLPSTSIETRAAIANLRESIRGLNIDTKLLAQRKQSRTTAQAVFAEERNRFCEDARSGRIKGLQLPEIERIEEATTIAQLSAIHLIQEKIRATIDEYADKLATLRDTMETNKAATVDNLVRFARQADTNLKILDGVMARTPDARFFVEAEVADEETIKRIIESLIIEIQDREQSARDRSTIALNKDIERRNKAYKEEIHKQIYANIFSRERVYFTHAAIWDGAKSPLTGEGGGLSTGQRTALMMMWLIKQAEYSLTRAALMYGSRKQQKAALKGAQRIMFFDGLFSNLSNEDYIDHAFQGLKDVDDNFQLIGLIHNPHYVNNKNIFPVHLVGKKKVGVKGGKRRRFVTVEPWQDDNGMITYTSAFRENAPSGGEARA